MQGCAGIVGPSAIAAIKTATGRFTDGLYLMSGACVVAALICVWFYRITVDPAPETANNSNV